MTETPDPEQQHSVTPSRRDRLRPAELLLFAAILAVFAGAVVAVTTRPWASSAEGGHPWAIVAIAVGGVFIAATMLLALLGLGGKPSAEDEQARKDLQRPEDGGTHWH